MLRKIVRSQANYKFGDRGLYFSVSSEDVSRASWAKKVRDYDGMLSFVGWGHLRPMRGAVADIAASAWAGRLLASSSHERLIVVAPGCWPIRHLCIVPATDGHASILRRESVSETDCGRVPMEGLYQALQQHFEWLEQPQSSQMLHLTGGA